MSQPDVDVVIPLFNKAPYVEQAILSVLEQSCPVATVVVADDASTDDGAERAEALARTDPRVRVLRSSELTPRGASAARNRGIAAGQAELVAFLDADDYWDRDKLAARVGLLRDPTIGTVHCGARQVDEGGQVLSVTLPPAPPPPSQMFDEVRLARYGVTGSASAVVCRRAVLKEAGPFPEHIDFGEDWDMWSRLAAVSGFAAVPAPLTNVRVLPTMSRTMLPEESFAKWLRVFDRWQDDERFMRKAEWEARSFAARHQISMLPDLTRAFMSFPNEIARNGGALGKRIYGNVASRAQSFALMPPLVLLRTLRALRRDTRNARLLKKLSP